MSATPPGPATPLVMILFANPLILQPDAILQTLQNLHPDHCEPAMPDADQSFGRTTLLRFDGYELGLITANAPLPEPIVEGAHLMGSEAAEICARHRAHVVVGLRDQLSDALICARVLTAVAGAVVACHEPEVLGGLWDGKVLTSTPAWQHLSPKAYNPYPDLPVDLWVRIMRFPVSLPGQAGFLTRGLDRFAGWELEMTGPAADPKHLALRVRSVARHLVQNGPVFQDGVTYRISPTEQLEVHIGPSPNVPSVEVISASLSPIGPETTSG